MHTLTDKLPLVVARTVPHPWEEGQTRNVYEFPVTRKIVIETDVSVEEDKVLSLARRTHDQELDVEIIGESYRMSLSSVNDQPPPIMPALSTPASKFGCDALLESRHETMLQWREPRLACGPEGNDLDAHIILRATVHDCINMQRHVAKAAGRPTMGDDGNHLLDFMATHWAQAVEVGD